MNSGWFGVLTTLIGFLSALLVMWRNNAANARRQEAQLIHDADQRHLERIRTLQREVYLPVAEAIAQWQEYLSCFSPTGMTPQEHTQIIIGARQKITKAYVVGAPDTLEALDKLNLFFSESAIALSEKQYAL